jgi:hypothetical protein
VEIPGFRLFLNNVIATFGWRLSDRRQLTSRPIIGKARTNYSSGPFNMGIVFRQATTAEAVKVSVGMGRSRCQVMAIGRSPVWLTYCPVPNKRYGAVPSS